MTNDQLRLLVIMVHPKKSHGERLVHLVARHLHYEDMHSACSREGFRSRVGYFSSDASIVMTLDRQTFRKFFCEEFCEEVSEDLLDNTESIVVDKLVCT